MLDMTLKTNDDAMPSQDGPVIAGSKSGVAYNRSADVPVIVEPPRSPGPQFSGPLEGGQPLDGPTLERHLGDALKAARIERRKTQQDAAAFLQVTHSAIGQWERGLHLPSLSNLIAIAEFYGASLDRLVWNMANKFDARLRELPKFLRESLIAKWTADLVEAEDVIKRFPGISAEPVPDKDARVVSWANAPRDRREKSPPR